MTLSRLLRNFIATSLDSGTSLFWIDALKTNKINMRRITLKLQAHYWKRAKQTNRCTDTHCDAISLSLTHTHTLSDCLSVYLGFPTTGIVDPLWPFLYGLIQSIA